MSSVLAFYSPILWALSSLKAAAEHSISGRALHAVVKRHPATSAAPLPQNGDRRFPCLPGTPAVDVGSVLVFVIKDIAMLPVGDPIGDLEHFG